MAFTHKMNMHADPKRAWATAYILLGFLLLLTGCASVSPASSSLLASPAAGLSSENFLPTGIFNRSPAGTSVVPTSVRPPVSPSLAPLGRFVPEVLLYASPSTRDYFSSAGINAKAGIQTWEKFLVKYKIPYRLVTSIDHLEKLQPGALLLPSSVALSEREKQAVATFRAQGGSILASWLTGVRNEKGEWAGFSFMEETLDVRVVGNTESDETQTFLMPHGDNPISHNLPSGLRVWLERASGWYPLRLAGRQSAAEIMDWGRTLGIEKSSSAVAFDERSELSGRPSRSVVLGYPERLWSSADPHAIEAMAHNVLLWLLRQPDAYVAAWPHPYSSAAVVALTAAEMVEEYDLVFAKKLEAAGGRATYYLTGEKAAKSAKVLKQLQARGHEVAYYGDRFEPYKGQTLATQSQRMDNLLTAMQKAGFDFGINTGFYPPQESYDATTEKLLKARAFGHLLAYKDASEARLPFFAGPDAAAIASPAGAMVVLPRTQNSPEYLTEKDPEDGLQTFLGELTLSEQMGSLSVITFPNQTLLTKAQLGKILAHLASRKERLWLATSGQVAQWWHDRDRVSSSLDTSASTPVLAVSVKGTGSLKNAVSVWINLPSPESTLRLASQGNPSRTPAITRIDRWRAAVTLEGLAPGEYRWNVYFDALANQVTQ